jgi:hypothetical protein
MNRVLKYLPLILPMIQKARKDPRVQMAIAKAKARIQQKPGGTGRKR